MPFTVGVGCHHQLEGLEMWPGALQPERIASQNLGRRPKEKDPAAKQWELRQLYPPALGQDGSEVLALETGKQLVLAELSTYSCTALTASRRQHGGAVAG